MSPAPMRIPSSANTTPLSGCMTMNSGQSASARSMTAGSSVNACGSRSRPRKSTRPTRRLNASDQPMTRLPAATAPSTSPAPSMRPTSTCAAIATASSTSAMKMKMPKAIWCAASDGSPTLREHGARREERDEQRRRAQEELPRDPDERLDQLGRRPTVDARPAGAQEQHRERAAHPDLRDHGADRRAVEPPVEPVDEQDLQHAFASWAAATMMSGVRRSPMPRRCPCPARAMSASGSPRAEMRR